jgi:hypothetical protein
MDMHKRLLISLLLALAGQSLYAQMCDYGFERSFGIVVTDSGSFVLNKAWDGGLNTCHFNQIDLNFDGNKDLVIFDKAGDKILCYENVGNTHYVFAPEYEHYFPDVFGWIQLLDYNRDGKEDFFAYTPAGMQVWKNISDTLLKFKMVTPMLTSWMGSGYSNIPLTYVDYPGISDFDGDGDLDILAFFGLGSQIQYHRNLSIETYGNCDTLLFEKTFNCWGDVAESSSSNHVFLDIVCPWKCHEEITIPKDDSGPKHTGSTMLVLDMNADSVKELVLGDVDYLNLTLLVNGGTKDTAHISSSDTLFPSSSVPVNLVSFPLATYVDVDFDGVRDLLVSPFDPNPAVPISLNSVWYYHNAGADNLPVFNYQQPDFFQEDMIDLGTGAYPVMFDMDADGLEDLIVSNIGYLDSSYYEFGFLRSVFVSQIAYYRNTGTAGAAAFTLVDKDLLDLSNMKLLSLFPAFGDLDGDGDKDMVCGESQGKLLYFENTAGPGNPAVFANPMTNWQSIDVGDYSAPAIVDLDGDSLLDLAIGKRSGMISWYRNTGTVNSPAFTLITDTLGDVNVTDYTYSYTGFSTPHFFRDSNNLLKLIVGSEQGRIWYYKDIESNLYGAFTSVDSVLLYTYQDSLTHPVKDGTRTGATTCDLNGDNYPDLITGNLRGGLNAYVGRIPGPFSGVQEQSVAQDLPMTVYPNPAQDQLWVSLPQLEAGSSYTFRLFDMQGKCRLALYDRYEPLLNVRVSELPSGIYFYLVNQGMMKGSGKVLLIK